jgi:hypothetical protein
LKGLALKKEKWEIRKVEKNPTLRQMAIVKASMIVLFCDPDLDPADPAALRDRTNNHLILNCGTATGKTNIS